MKRLLAGRPHSPFAGGQRVSRRQIGISTFSALLAIVLAACGRPTPAPLLFNPAPWQSGETHRFAVTSAEGQPAGELTFTIDEGVNDVGERLWVIERSTQALGDEEVSTVKVSEQGYRPQSSYLQRSNADGEEAVDALYSSGQVDLTLTTKQNVLTVQRTQVPSDARETVTLPMIVRALPLAKNYATQLNAFLPVANLLDRVTVTVIGEETVQAPAGSYKTWVVELDTGGSKSKLWIAQEPPYPLIKFVDGRNKGTFELSEYSGQ
jgi:hypothetical protein